MTRILRATLLDNEVVAAIVLVNSETRDPTDVARNIYNRHIGRSNKSFVIALKPCIEE